MENILNRGTVDVINKQEVEEKLKSSKKLRIKLGIDPTGSELHLGHAVVLRKLKEFQDAGHTVILLIGDYTARIGDPTGKSETRKVLTSEEIASNMKSYIEQASRILDVTKLEIRHNSEWFDKLTMGEILEMTAKKTVNQMLAREDFKNRYTTGNDISLTELLYPLMQGYDSVALQSDIEIGGTDQLFNMLVGRDLQKAYGSKVLQSVITVPLLEGLHGGKKMSKSLNNYIGITESAKEIYGKTMSIVDEMIIRYFELTTEVSTEEISQIKRSLDSGENPKTFKMRLAKELVTLYHDLESAEKAEAEFNNVFKNKGLPDDIETIELKGGDWNIIELVNELKLGFSKSDIRRNIEGGGVRVNQEKVEKIDQIVSLGKEKKLIQIGKRHFKYIIGK